MRIDEMRTGEVTMAELIPCFLNSLGVCVQTTEEQQRELHEEGTCAPEVCIHCEREREKKAELLTLRGLLLGQVREIEAELGI